VVPGSYRGLLEGRLKTERRTGAGLVTGDEVERFRLDTTAPRRLTTIADLAGSWALTAWDAVSVADTSRRLDLKAQLGADATLEVAATGAAVFTASVYGQAPTVQHVTLTLTGDTLIYHEIAGDTRFLLDGTHDHMTWRGVIPQYQDVDGDGTPDETRTWMEFVRL